MYSFKTIIIILVAISTLVLSVDLISESDELKEGKVNLTYIPIALGVSMVGLMYVAFWIMFIKYIWELC